MSGHGGHRLPAPITLLQDALFPIGIKQLSEEQTSKIKSKLLSRGFEPAGWEGLSLRLVGLVKREPLACYTGRLGQQLSRPPGAPLW